MHIMPKCGRSIFAHAVFAAFLAPWDGYGQSPDAVYRIVSSKESTFQEDLDRAAVAGYRIVGGDAATEVAVVERTTDGVRRSYVFAPDVERFLQEKRLQPGFRLVRSTFAADEFKFSAVFEKAAADEEPREYSLVKAGSTGALRKRFQQDNGAGLALVAVAAGQSGVAALYERRADAPKTLLIASGNTGTLQQELTAAAEKGYCAVDADGIKEALYAMEECPAGAHRRRYEVIAATKNGTLEKELNAGVARGLRLVPVTLVGIQKRMLLNSYNNEAVAVLETAVDSTPVSYRVVGALRVSTLEKELKAASDDDFSLVAFAIGPKEVLAVLEKK